MPGKKASFRTLAPVATLAALGLVACASQPNSETTGSSAAALDAYCTAKVNGVGTLDVETDYLPHVVHCENGGAPLESLKAQAVAARSYLYYKLDSSGSIDDGQGDQVYSCASEPDADDIEAVAETSGIVLQYHDATICSFFVAGADATPPDCVGTGSDPTGTEAYVTYNQGTSGSGIDQTTLGYVSPTNYANRGCMSQLGSRCLADQGDSFDTILKFYYGADIGIVEATGACITASLPDGGSIFGPDGSVIGSQGGPAPQKGDGAADNSSNDGSTLDESSGCAISRDAGKKGGSSALGIALALFAVTRARRRGAAARSR